MDSERKRVQKFFTKPSKTRQEFKQECDLGYLIKKFAKTPEGFQALEQTAGYADNLRFDDVSQVPDFRTARDTVLRANATFMALPAIVRSRFNNDPAIFLDFTTNPANLEELRKMGLAKPAPVVPKSDKPVASAG